MQSPRIVTVIVPCRNEADHIDRFLDSLFQQKLPDGTELEVLIADGASDDGTRARIEPYRQRRPRIRVIDNPKRIVSVGLNAAIRQAHGEVVLRMDVHTLYARDYIGECLRALHESGADNVGGPWVAAGSTYLSKAIAIAFASRFVSGGGRAHDPTYEGDLDTVYLGCWRREVFEKYGLFDEELVRSQDNELNLRIQRGGGRIWQTPRIRSRYAPRGSLRQLFRQYTQYGYWKVRVIRKHKIPASVRQLVPGGFVACLLLLAAATPFSDWAWRCLLALIALYGAASVASSATLCGNRSNWRYLPVMPAVFATYHFGFGYGFLRGVADFVVLRRAGRPRFAVLTRSSTALSSK
jgi:glycosyltransferase involved in cell wall biosynthesis